MVDSFSHSSFLDILDDLVFKVSFFAVAISAEKVVLAAPAPASSYCYLTKEEGTCQTHGKTEAARTSHFV